MDPHGQARGILRWRINWKYKITGEKGFQEIKELNIESRHGGKRPTSNFEWGK